MSYDHYYQSVLESMNEQVYVRDLDMNILYINPAAERLTGWSLSEALKKKCYEVFGDEDLVCKAVCPVEKALSDKCGMMHHEGELKSRSGRLHKMRVSIAPFREEGKAGGAVIVLQDVTDLKNLEETHVKTLIKLEKEIEAGKKKELELRRAQAVARVGSWRLDFGSNVLTWSEETSRMFGVEPGSRLNLSDFIELVHPEDRERMQAAWRAALKGEVYETEHRVLGFDQEIWVQERAEIFFNEKGEPVEAVGTVFDVTQRKQLETLLQSESDMASAWSKSGSFSERMEICLVAAIQASGMDCGGFYLIDESDQSLSLKVHRGVSEEFLKRASRFPADSNNARLVRRGEPVYALHSELLLRKDDLNVKEGFKAVAIVPLLCQGRTLGCLNLASRSMSAVPGHVRAALEGIARYAGSFVAQEIEEEKSRQSHRDLEELFNTIEDMLFILDMEGNILGHNRIVSGRLEYGQDELTGRHVLAVHPEDRHDEARRVIAAMLAGKSDICMIPLIAKSGRLIPVETKVKLGRWAGKEVIFGTSRDISERLKLEADRLALERRLQQIEKAESLSRMAGAVAHNFNNMMMVVAGNLEMAQMALPPESKAAGEIEEARKAARKASETSRLMLTFLGQSSRQTEILDLSETCRKCLIEARASLPEGMELEADLPSPGPRITADPTQICQLISNLVTNAFESMEDCPGTARVTVNEAEASEVPSQRRFPKDWAPSEKRYARVSVSDRGRGMQEEIIDSIFDPYFSEKFTGRGLGLAVALGIAKSCDGCVTVDTKPGKGSLFQVFVPLA